MTTEMYDSIDPSQIPAGQDDAGYVDGRWRTYSQLHGPHNLSVAVFAADDADTIDDEAGDATNEELPGWVHRELGLGHWRPVTYFAVSNSPGAAAALQAGGIARAQIRCWTAHYNYRPHLCDQSCGLDPWFGTADATQWTDASGGRNLDESTIADDFFPPTTPTPAPEDYMKLVQATNPATNTSAQYLIRTHDVLHVPDATCSGWAYTEFNNGQGVLEAVPWEIILWLNNGQTPT